MKTPDDIKKGLECCNKPVGFGTCANTCPFDDDETDEIYNCTSALSKDALAYINQLEQRLTQAERERDAAVKDLSNSCTTCKFVRLDFDDSPCDRCFQRDGKYPLLPTVRTRFEWRGVCDENSKEENNG